jgi:hypothetical protein
MKVSELVKELKKYNEDDELMLWSGYEEGGDVDYSEIKCILNEVVGKNKEGEDMKFIIIYGNIIN